MIRNFENKSLRPLLGHLLYYLLSLNKIVKNPFNLFGIAEMVDLQKEQANFIKREVGPYYLQK